MGKKNGAPAVAKGFSRQALYACILLIGAAPTLTAGLSMTPNYKRARGWEAADTRYTVGYYLTLVGSVLGVFALCALLVDHAGPVGPSRRRSEPSEDDNDDE